LKPSYDLGIFVGELEDIPDKTFGFGLPKRRDFARARYTFVGYVFPFAVSRYAAKQEVRQQLGYGPEPLAICSIGGTSIGRKLPELCAKAFALAQQKRPDLRMVLATGPRVSAESIELSRGITARGFLPRLYEHFAAGDLAIVQGGATSTFELTALRRPFIYFPIEGHCEQANVSRNLSRRGAGVPMTLSRTTPELLAGKILELIDSTPSYPDIPVDGARKAAQAILKLLDRREQPEAAPRQTMAGPSPFLPSTK
jgi:UDP-N-acetylglucosamine:LPS N-acetylglucosamine transferase